jgi:hypothetical protein
MKLQNLILMIVIPLIGAPALAQNDTSSSDYKPSFSASQSVTATARVEAIDHESREVTLLLEDGELVTSQVSDEARNLGQVSVGDLVYAHYTESISIRVIESYGAEPEAFIQEDMARSGEGMMPGIAATESAVTTAIVEEINLDDNTFKLREADGEVRQYTARNPDNLRRAEVGDKVVTTVTTSVVITVDKQPNE